MPKRMVMYTAYIALAVFIFFIVFLSFSSARADVLDDLDSVYDNLSTYYAPPSYYHGPSRHAFSLGGFKVFLPNQVIHPITIQPPEIHATCGGISAFFGGFSFIDADKFVQLLQNVMNAAAGYFFEMAIEQLCPTCHNIMSLLRHAAQLANKLAMDSCGVGRWLAKKYGGELLSHASLVKKIGSTGSSYIQALDEKVENLLNGDTSDEDSTVQDDRNNCDPRSGKSCLTGNYTYEWVKAAGGSDEDAELLMSLMGTFVWDAGNPGTDLAPIYYKPIITSKMLVDGCKNSDKDQQKGACKDLGCSDDQIPMYKCNDNKCLDVSKHCVSKTNLIEKVEASLSNILDSLNNRENVANNNYLGVFYYTPVVKEIWNAIKYYPKEYRDYMIDEMIDTTSEAFVYLYLEGFLRSIKQYYLKLSLVKIGPQDMREYIRDTLTSNLNERFRELETLRRQSMEIINQRIANLKNLLQIADILHKKTQEMEKIVSSKNSKK